MIITCGSIKGGVGKSLTAVNLTVMRALSGKSVLLIDADDQATSSSWSTHRESKGLNTPWTTIKLKGKAVRTEVLKMMDKFSDIIIDCGGRDTSSLRAALTVSDKFIVPFQPKSFDIWTADSISELIGEAKVVNDKLLAFAFINFANSRGTENEEAQNVLSETEGLSLLPVTIGARKAFPNATSAGLGVTEAKSDPKAIIEMQQLYNAIFI